MYPQFYLAYTDASKNTDGVGAAVNIQNSTLQFKLPEASSVFTGERHSASTYSNENKQISLIITDPLNSIHIID